MDFQPKELYSHIQLLHEIINNYSDNDKIYKNVTYEEENLLSCPSL